MSKKIKGVFAVNGQVYTVGTAPDHLDEGDVVKEIQYHRAGKVFNSGFQTGVSGYSVHFTNSEVKRLIPEIQAAEIVVDMSKEEKAGIPDLPAADQKADNTE